MTDSKQRKIGVILSYMVIVLNIIISILYTPFLTNKLGQSEYGLYSLVNNIISYLTILDFGFASAIIIYTSKYKSQKEQEKEYNLYGMFLIIYTIIGFIVSLLGIVLIVGADNFFANTMSSSEIYTAKRLMIILTINLVFTFPLSVFTSIINAYERYIFLKISNIFTIICKPLIMIPLLFLEYKSTALALVITIVNLSSLLINLFYCFKKLKIKVKFNKMDFKLIVSIISFSFWIFLNSVIDKINWSLDSFLLGTFSGTVAVSVYAIASQINQLYISFSTAITGVLLPKVTKMVEANAKDEDFTNILIKVGRIQLMIVGLILTGFIIFGKEFIVLWVGNDYIDSYKIAIWLMAPMIVSLIQNSCTSVVQAKNRHKFLPITLLFTSILNIFISIPLIKNIGGLGAAIGTAVSLVIGNIILKNIYYHKVVKINMIKFFKKISKIFIYQILLMIFSMIIMNLFEVKIMSWLRLAICIIVYVIVYFCGLLTILNEYEKSILNRGVKIFKKLFNKEKG